MSRLRLLHVKNSRHRRRSSTNRHRRSSIHVSVRSQTNNHKKENHSLSQRNQTRVIIQTDPCSSKRTIYKQEQNAEIAQNCSIKYGDSVSQDRWNSVNNYHRRKTRKRYIYFRTCCNWNWCICIFLCICATILIGAAIAAILMALVNKSSVTNTTSTTTTSATTTSATTTSTATSSTTTTSTTTTSTTTTSTTTTSTATTSTTTTSTTTTPNLTLLTNTNEFGYPIWNTFAGGDSTPSVAGSSVGNYYPSETASNAFDQNSLTKYTNFGSCNSSYAYSCGLNTGVYLTPSRGSSCLHSLRFCTSADSLNRDPITVTIEGSNQPSSLLIHGSSWTLIYNGSSGLDINPGRCTYGVTQNISNSAWYLSYRILVTSKRGVENSAEYAEIELIGY